MNSILLREVPTILKTKVQNALKNLKYGKALSPDNFEIEIINALQECGIDHIIRLLNTVYNTGDIPPNLCKFMFTAITKIARAVECHKHCTIYLMSHVTMILLKITMQRVRQKIQPDSGRIM